MVTLGLLWREAKQHSGQEHEPWKHCPEFEFCLCYSLAVWPWLSFWTSLGLSFLTCKKGFPLLFLSWSVTSVMLPSAPLLLQRETKHLPKNRVKVQVGDHRNCYWVPESSRPYLGKDLQFWQKKNDFIVTVIWSGLGRNRGQGGLPGSEECKWRLDSQYETAGKVPVQPFLFFFFNIFIGV